MSKRHALLTDAFVMTNYPSLRTPTPNSWPVIFGTAASLIEMLQVSGCM